jgi:hypothetical protein
MRSAVYNSSIPRSIPNTVKRARLGLRIAQLLLLLAGLTPAVHAGDWNSPEQQLARKIVAVTGPGAVSLTVENRSSLGRRDYEVIQNGLRNVLEGLGLRFVTSEQAAATVTISLSENPTSYVWVAQIKEGSADPAVVMLSTPRAEGSMMERDSVPLTLRKIPVWTQDDPIVDVAVLEENPAPSHIAVLDAAKVSLYRMQGGKWQLEQELPVVHQRPWPRDLRGRLVAAGDHLLSVYLPGVTCVSTATPSLTLSCRASDDPWPLLAGTVNGGNLSVFPSAGLASGASIVVPQMKAFFASTRNFFTGALAPGIGKFTNVPKFYSAAVLPREKYNLWLFATLDGQMHMVDGVSDQVAKLGWGNGLASVKTACGAGWQVLSSSKEGAEDAVRAYEFPDRDPVAVTAAVGFPGAITALWTESKGDTAIAVVKNQETGSYEAFRLAMVCGQ